MGCNRILLTGIATLALVACDRIPDFDLRDLGNGFDTSQAVANLPDRPAPDGRGVISYPSYQVVVAQRDDTIRTIAERLNIDTAELATFNGIEPDILLRRDELIALPNRVAEPVGGPIQPLDITSVATTALGRVESTQTTTLPAITPAPVIEATSTANTQSGSEPIRHRVLRGETVFQISRLYGVPVQNIAEWNSLNADLAVREGQFLLIPQGNAAPPTPTLVEEPGTGSVTPLPPSSTDPLPDEAPDAPETQVEAPEAPDIGTVTTSQARFSNPVDGNVIRAYAPGRNEGIDIGVSAGTSVRAADSGTVAAVTTDTNGVAIVVIKHPDNLLTVYTNLEGLAVAKNDTVSRGQTLGKVRAGDPSFLHFEVRRGLQSVDPAEFLP